MEASQLGKELGEMSAKITATDKRISEHISAEEKIVHEIFAQLKAINDLLSQATGARKVLVWVLGTVIAALLLAKGWLFPGAK